MTQQEFYGSINEDTFAGADFCRKLYGYCYTDSSFLERVMDKFKSFGRDNVIYIYSFWVRMYIHFQLEEEKEAAEWLVRETDRNYERKVKETGCRERQRQKMPGQGSRKWMEGMF